MVTKCAYYSGICTYSDKVSNGKVHSQNNASFQMLVNNTTSCNCDQVWTRSMLTTSFSYIRTCKSKSLRLDADFVHDYFTYLQTEPLLTLTLTGHLHLCP